MRVCLLAVALSTVLSVPAHAAVHWDRMPGTLVNISVADGNNVWGSNGSEHVYRWNDATSQWVEQPCCMKQASMAPDGTMWGVSGEDRPYRWNGTGWTKMTGGMHNIDVGNKDEIWGVNADNDIYRWNGTGWTEQPGALSRVSVGSDGTVWGVNVSNEIFRWLGGSWQRISGSLKQISVGNAHYIWGTNEDNEIFRWNGESWDHVSGSLAWLSVGEDGVVWGVNADHEVFRMRELAVPSTGNMMLQSAAGPLDLSQLNQSLLSPTTCWIGTGTRGVGTVPDTCGAGQEKDGGLCYNKCDPGEEGIGPVCWGDCPSGYTNTGLLCTWSGSLIKACDWSGPWYDLQCHCPANYVDAGLVCAATTVSRPSHGRGVGKMPKCSSGKHYDAGLCYGDCPNSNSVAVGPICWNNCPSNFPVPCGAMCAKNATECALATTDICVSAASVALNFASMGTTSALTAESRLAAHESAEAIGAGVNATNLSESTGTVLNGYGTGATIAGDVNGVDPDQAALQIESMEDETGLMGLALSLAKPVCGQSPPPAVALSGTWTPAIGTAQHCSASLAVEYTVGTAPKHTVWAGTFDGTNVSGLPRDPSNLAYLNIRPLVLDASASATFTLTLTRTPCGGSTSTVTATCTNTIKTPTCTASWVKLLLDSNTGVLTMKING